MTKLKRIALTMMVVFTFGGGLTALPPETVQARTTYVWIAPKYGKKYHYNRSCRGLNHASRTKRVKLSWAKRHYYKLCKWG
ncbi:hypothetical protein [Lactiplantibacillus daowaiensis]|uniref:Extracellular protein n=1 Tax=Lactiplantibacillus daowaiensis TaxID=2559918 RepID=A0ABW1S3B0_9LACO|nr:hypothetical protein [Lactiplantibacillus daowaiensis]